MSMRKINPESCEFHLVIGGKMKKQLGSLDIFEKTVSLSGKIEKILSLLIPVMERKHKWGKQRKSEYKIVSRDPAEKREHVHAYLPISLYRRLKLMHQDLNAYSIAQLIREFLGFFLRVIDVFGDETINILKKIFYKWKRMKEVSRPTTNELLRQLRTILLYLPGHKELINIYDQNFSPLWIFQL
jgi:hypothetical protein